MKSTVVWGAIIVGSLLAGPARADKDADWARRGALYQISDHMRSMWTRDDPKGPWKISDGASDGSGKAVCKELIANAEKAGVTDADMIEMAKAGPDWIEGPVSLGDMKLVCNRMQRMIDIKQWERWAVFSLQELSKKGGGDIKFYENCLQNYDAMLKKGVAADSQVIPDKANDANGVAVEWSGTVKDLNQKYCVAGLKKAKEEQSKRDAPYKKVMKGEKLETALTYRGVFLAGGSVTEDPAVMAKAAVWFIDTEPQEWCANAMQKHVVHRYEFAGDKLAKSTNIETCGVPRANTFK